MKIREKSYTSWLNIFLPWFFVMFFSSCSHDKYDNESLYSSVGFEPGSAPALDPRAKYSSDYYYRQAQMGGGQMGAGQMGAGQMGGGQMGGSQPRMYQGQMPAPQ
ncbi:MAG: hypothetical protein ACKN9I_03315, partial [Alphaproteobacteria bacterium]